MFTHQMILGNLFFTNEDWCSFFLFIIAVSSCQCWNWVSSFHLMVAGGSCISFHQLGSKRVFQNMVRYWESGQIPSPTEGKSWEQGKKQMFPLKLLYSSSFFLLSLRTALSHSSPQKMTATKICWISIIPTAREVVKRYDK